MATPAIETHDLEKRYGETQALRDLNLRVERGELFGLLGPNGAGKTTTINILCGLVKPSGGWARVDGIPLANGSDGRIKDLIGVCPQELGIFSYLTGRENVEFFGALHGMPRDRVRAQADRLLEAMSLSEEADRKVKGYSGGMKRRISLITALVSEPEIAFLDEPTTGMDPQSRRTVWEFIKGLKARGTTVVLTTHYMEEAEVLCDRVAIIDRGHLIALGTPEELRRQNGAANLEEVFLKLTGRSIREGM